MLLCMCFKFQCSKCSILISFMQDFVLPSFYSCIIMVILSVLAFLAEVLLCTIVTTASHFKFWVTMQSHCSIKFLDIFFSIGKFLSPLRMGFLHLWSYSIKISSSKHSDTKLQVFLARGLQLEKISKVTNIMYIEVIFLVSDAFLHIEIFTYYGTNELG